MGAIAYSGRREPPGLGGQGLQPLLEDAAVAAAQRAPEGVPVFYRAG